MLIATPATFLEQGYKIISIPASAFTLSVNLIGNDSRMYFSIFKITKQSVTVMNACAEADVRLHAT